MILTKTLRNAMHQYFETEFQQSFSLRFNGNPGNHYMSAFGQELLKVVEDMKKIDFPWYLACQMSLSGPKLVIVFGFSEDLQGKHVWYYNASGEKHFDFCKTRLGDSMTPMPLQASPNYGFQYENNNQGNMRAYCARTFGYHITERIVQWSEDHKVDFETAFEALVLVPEKYDTDPQYWLNVLRVLHNNEDQMHDKVNKAQAKWDRLRNLIAGRIQKDGSKMLFKAKHLTDLPKDFADQLEAALCIGEG